MPATTGSTAGRIRFPDRRSGQRYLCYSHDGGRDEHPQIFENAGEGIDTVESAVTYSIANLANVENITLTGAAAINATGNSTANVLTGNSGDNVMTGGGGIDTLNGGAGNESR